MNCPVCGHPNRENARFCDECGERFARACGSCQAELRPAAKFCDECGTPVAGTAQTRAPADHTPKHLAEKILGSKSAMEGERKQLTVLFADVKGSMEISEDLDPEAWHGILDRFFEILADGVHRFEGTVNQYTGDGIMALFGAPIAHEDHAQRACYAALELREQIARYATEVKREHGVGFSTRMGIHSGDVVVGKIGDDLRMDYTAQGHTVGLAQRMESLASPDTCYLTGTTAALVSGYFELEDLHEFQVKGVRGPVPVHRLVGVGQARTRFDVSRARGLTRFVGRDADVETLENALAQAQAGNGQIVGVVAEAGTGKTRLCFEFAERCRASGMTVNEGQAVSHGKNVPLLPMLQVFRAYFDLQEGENDRRAREKIAGRMLLLDESFREALPVLFEFFGVPDPDDAAPRMDPDGKQQQIFSVLRRIVQGADPRAGSLTFMTLIEDLHWFDPASEAFLEQWVDALAGSSSFLLVNFRPEYRAGWMQKSYYRQLPLAPLGPEAIRELIDDLLGDDPSTQGLAEAIHERTGGNPFYAEEVVRALIESGQLEGERGRYRLVTAVGRLEVPASVKAVLSARIDRLPERDKQVLQTAAVIGKEFSQPILQAASDLPELELRESLAALKSGEFLYEQALYPVAEYTFKHPLTQEVALASQLQEKRRETHAAVARAVEAAHPDKLDERAALLAHHWEEAGEALLASRWHARAGAWHARNDPGQSQRHVQRVLDLTRDLDSSPDLDALRLEACRSLLAGGGWRLGTGGADPEAIYAEGRELADRLEDRAALHSLLIGYSAVVGFGGDVDRYAALQQEGLALIDDDSSPGAVGITYIGLAYSSYLQGRMQDAVRYTEQIPGVVGNDPDAGLETAGFRAVFWHTMGLGEYQVALGNLELGRSLLLEAVERCGTTEVEILVWAHGVLAELADLAGSLPRSAAADDGRRHALESMRIAEKNGGNFLRAYGARVLGCAYLMCGAPQDAREVLEAGLALAREHRNGLEREVHIMAHLSRAILACGDPAGARAVAEPAVARAQEQGTRYFQCFAELALARALRGGGAGTHEIAHCLRHARDLVAETGAKVLEPQVVEEEAWLDELEGNDRAATQKLRRARDLYARIGASGHVERLESELRD